MSNLKSKIFFSFLILFTTSFIINTSKNIVRFISLEKDLQKQDIKLAQLMAQKEELRKQLISFDEKGMESMVRDRLSMAKEGETIIVLPDEIKSLTKQKPEKDQKDMSNWEKWLSVFL